MNLFRSLKHRNFRLYFFGQSVSLLGVWMQGTAISWLTWRLTGSPRWLGAVGFATQIPILIFGLFAGVAADRFMRRRLVITIQIIAMLQAAILAFLTLTGHITPVLIFILSLFLGFIFAFDYPARQSFLMDMVGGEDIGNAIALNSSVVHAGRVLGPVVAGLLIAEFGEGACFAINSLSFLFVISALLLMRTKDLYPQGSENNHESIFKSITEGLEVAWNIVEIRKPLIFMSILSLAAMPYIFLMPQVVGERFGGSARELGLAMSMSGLGALIGAVYLALRKDNEGLYRQIKYCLFATGLGLVSIAFMPSLVAAAPSLVLIGIGSFIVVAGTNTIMQTLVPPQFRGRMMSIFTVSFFGFAPIGSLISGLAASRFGSHTVIAGGGAFCIMALAVHSISSSYKRTHQK